MTTHRTREIAKLAQTLSIEELQLLVGCFMINAQQDMVTDMFDDDPDEFDDGAFGGRSLWEMGEGMYDDLVDIDEVKRALENQGAFDLFELEIRKTPVAIRKEL